MNESRDFVIRMTHYESFDSEYADSSFRDGMAERPGSRSREQRSILRGVTDEGVLSLILFTGIVERCWLANFVHRVGVEVTPDAFVHVVAGFVFSCAAAGLD